ncbi:Gfo/Idh/MocA family protein [Paenibacillus hunanensis]|uniref:Dehydrogenase n=1 Tax=Paenibacillus hunanensis TaxID=539262 RepID=A0ABU1J0H2_9BACL|nr:Gfo/Idh/MocA family oxidoreductase [Paenibacillus hunanensis]MDR6244978.1 putative dehydrogenase [Paenibacillus hunanensis]GGI95762.1 deoxyfructose oxidoreductase [Paenibacillus hunanensis]
MTQERKLRWGILGSASIAIRSVIPGIQQSSLNEVTALASRTLDKAEQTATDLGIPKAYGSYEELLADASIDAVYIPLPNHLHYEWTLRAAEAGKHILCEKPIALNAAQAEEMAAAASKAGVHLAEAFMYRHHPRYEQIRDIIASGEIGDVRGIHSTFTFNSSGSDGNVRFRKDWGGGSLYDIGCYSISAARMLLGKEPSAATVIAMFSPQHGEVDMMASGLLEFDDHIGVTFDSGMWAAFRNTLEVLGTEGIIEVPSAYVSPGDERSNFFVTVGDNRREVQVATLNQYAAQADAFARTVLNGETPLYDAEDAVRNMRVLDACLKSAEERQRITL